MIHPGAADIQAEDRQILNVLRQQEWPAFEYEDALASVSAPEPEMLGDGRTEGAAADDDEVERTEIAAWRQTAYATGVGVNGDEHVIERVADIAPERIAGEVCIWC
jgi:hypothetical protein